MRQRFFVEVEDVPDREDIKILKFRGEIDITNSHVIIHKIFSLINSGAVRLVVDFGELKHINSSGIFNFLRCYAKLKEVKGWLRFINLKGPIKEILDALGITKIFAVYDNLEAALKAK